MTDNYAAATVCAVVITYQPEFATLIQLIDCLTPQVGAVVVVDNASDGAWQSTLDKTLQTHGGELLRQPQNMGLATAQNAGIGWARSNGYAHVLLLDQDSEPGEDMVAALLAALRSLTATTRVAAVGPRFHDIHEQKDAPFVRIGFPFNRKLWCESATQQLACDFLISSGTLIPLGVLDTVGPMDAGLFIDNVDLEWCFRARAKGYAFYGICAATMHHRLGDARHQLPFGLGQIVVHGPWRLYYMMRNRVRLYKMRHTPRVWIAQDVPRVMVKLFLFGVLIGPRWRNLQCMLHGLWDGLLERHGERPGKLP